MVIQELFEKALGITKPWYVEKLEFNADKKVLKIYINFKKGSSFEYIDDNGNKVEELKAYDTKTKRWRHLNFFEHECYLIARIPRVKLPNGKVRTIKTPWEGLSYGFTLLFEALVIQLCKGMPINKVSKTIGVHNDKIWEILDKYIGEAMENRDFSDIKSIGIDETSRRKGHKYVTIFVDLEERRTIYVTEGKSSETVKEFKKDFISHKGDIKSIKEVSCDMSKAFIKGVKENIPEARITFDKFHIIKLLNEALDKVRKQESKEKKILKGTRYLWLKNKVKLNKKEREKIKKMSISKIGLRTVRAYNIKEKFREIYKIEDRMSFEEHLKIWYYWATHSRLDPIRNVAKTIKEHWEGVINWIETRINNGILEGINSIIQAAKRKARGYKTFRNYKIIIYLLTGNLDFSSVNKFITH